MQISTFLFVVYVTGLVASIMFEMLFVESVKITSNGKPLGKFGTFLVNFVFYHMLWFLRPLWKKC